MRRWNSLTSACASARGEAWACLTHSSRDPALGDLALNSRHLAVPGAHSAPQVPTQDPHRHCRPLLHWAPLTRPGAMSAHAAGPRRRRTVAAAGSGRRCTESLAAGRATLSADRPCTENLAAGRASPSHTGRFPPGGGGAPAGPPQEHNAGHGDRCEGRDRSPWAAVGGERPADQTWTFPTPV
jgi:hypothetical protein